MTPTPYLRHPHIQGETIAFTADDGVWLAPVSGGRAWRLTSDRAPVRSPRISPEGTRVAYIAVTDGQPEVHLADIDSGTVTRLTYWGNPKTVLLGWDGKDTLLAATNSEEVHRHQVVRTLSTDGSWRRLSYGSAQGLAVSEAGAVVLSTMNTRPHAHWKRYRGGTAPRLWTDLKGTGEWTKLLPEESAGLVDPLFIGETLLFVSDRGAAFPHRTREQANLWIWEDWKKAAKRGGTGKRRSTGPQQLSFQTEAEGYVRDATTDGTRVTWHSRGVIWVLDSLTSTPRKLDVALPGTEPAPLTITARQNLRSLTPDHGADASLVSWRGKTFWLTHREGPARALVADSGVRTREPLFLGRTGRAALVTDADGEDSLEIHTLDGSAPPQRILTGELGRVLHIACDPAGERLAVLSHDGWIRLITLPSSGGRRANKPQLRTIARSRQGEPLTPSFSPDGRHLIWSQPTEAGPQAQMHQLMLLDTSETDSAPVELTSGTFHDFSPAFTADGKHVAFLSNRTFDPDYDDHEFTLSFRGATRPWLIPLTADEPAPFGPSAEGWRLSRGAQNNDDDGAAGSADATPVSPGAEPDAEERAVPFPVPSASYRNLQTAKGGVLWIRRAQEAGALGTRRAGVPGEPAGDQLIRWDFAQRKATTIVEKLNSYAVSGDGERMVVRSGTTITVRPSTRKIEKNDDAERVAVDTSRLRLRIDRLAEWQQMFEETCRLMAQQFWREDMDGVDWDGVVDRWRPVVSTVRSHDDLQDLLWEVVAELNTSHAYVVPKTAASAPRLGRLGADLSAVAGGWRIDRILPGESSDPRARSPLHAAGVGAREGDLITAVDGHPVDAVFGPAKHLTGAADKPVELQLRRDGEQRRVVVVPLADESALRYQDWVRSRRDYVRSLSGGRLGYVHVPDMTSTGWAQLHRDLRMAVRAEGLIADVRYNGGGHTSQMVIARLAQRVIAWMPIRHQDRFGTYPEHAPRGPVVMVANQYSGSDGDIVNAAAQAMGVGPVVGERTWGGVIGIDSRFNLVDGTVVTQPKYGEWISGYGWDLENHGVDPDIEVVHDPGQLFRDDDPQLEAAVAEALARLEAEPAAAPPQLPAPKVR